ncbi:MAG: Ig-like domain-containing protein, partial [Eubacteriales bacterium]
HEHVIVYSMLEDGVTILARCATEGCELHDHPSTLTVTAPTETVENEAGETEETDPVYDGTAKYAGVVVDGRVDLWSDVLITYQRKDPDTGEWTEMPKITRLVDSVDEATGELIDEEALDGLPIDAGEYMALVGFWNEDGQLVAAGVEFTIWQRPLTVTAVDQTVLSIDQISEGHSRIRTGDGELLEGHDVLGFTLTPSPNDEGATEGDIVPSEVVVWDDREQADVTANYAITCVNGKFHVRNAPASVKAAPKAVEDLVYDGGPQALVTAGTAEGGTMRYALGADEATAPSGGWEDTIPTGTGAGTYYIWYMASGDDAHTDTEPAGPVPVTIGPRTAQLAWDHTALTYSGSAQAPTAKVSNLAGGSEWIDSCEVTVEGAQTAPGSYTATATGLSNANYALPEQNTVDFTIEKAAGTIAFGEGSVSKQYGDEAFTNELTNTGDGRVTYASDDTTVATVDEATGEVTIAGIGTATVTATAEDSANCGYEAKTAAFTLTVSPKAAQIQFAQASVNKPFGSSP